MAISTIRIGGNVHQERSTAVINITMSLLIIGLAIFVIAKYHKKEGFWYGFLALLLLGSFIEVGGKNTETKTEAK